MATAKLTSKGQMTLPLEIRQHLGLRSGDHIKFTIEADGSVLLRTATPSLDSLAGMLKAKRHVTLEEIEETIRRRRGKPR